MPLPKKAPYFVLAVAFALILSACGLSEEEPYSNAVQRHLNNIDAAYADMAGQLTAADSDPSLWDDPAWHSKLNTDAAIVHESHKAISALNPPESFTNFHPQLVSATQNCADGMDAIAAAAETKDTNQVLEALELAEDCGDKLNDLSDQLRS